MEDAARALTRHAIAALAYRGAKVLRDAPPGFGDVRAGDFATGTRSALEILAHVNDLLGWTARILGGAPDWLTAWQAVPPGAWDDECRRFHARLSEVDHAILGDATPTLPLEHVFQGPIVDAFTHLGQLALLRRLAGAPIRGEVMVLSDVVPGRVGPDQSPPVREFG
jgi:hypothetical protein